MRKAGKALTFGGEVILTRAFTSVVFGGFSAEALANRIQDARSKIVVTADEVRQRNRMRLILYMCG